MNLKFSGTNFLSDLREADNILKIDKFSISYNDKISDDDIKYDLSSIWIKEKNLLKLSIDLTNLMENLNNISIVCYYTSKSRNNNVVENTSKPAFILKPGTTEYIVRSINLIDLNFSNIKNILSDIKPVLPNELNLIESFSLDIGSSIFLIDDIDEKNLITKDSFEKKLFLKRDENNESVFDYGQTQLNSNGEFLYRKYIYRKYNEDQFFPEFICSDSGAVKKVEENITTYMISNNRSVLKLSGVVGYTDLVIENNKIIDKIEGYQKINEIPGLKIEKTYITDVINNIWGTTAIVENKVNVVVPENEESDVKEDFLTVSASFMNYDNSFINLSKKFKIIQSKLIRTGTRIWEVDYNLDNIKLDYEYYPEKDKLPIPVLIFQDKYKVTDELETEIKFQYINHEIIDKIAETGGLTFSYEYLDGYEILLKTAEEVFNEFFEISVGEVSEDCSQILTVKSKSVESYQTIDNWYPQVSIDGNQTQSTVIKVKISVNLDNYLDLEGFESEFIILRQPNISYRGYIDYLKSIDLKKSSMYDDSPLYLGTALLLMKGALDHILIEDDTTDNYYLRNLFCGWCPDKFVTDIPIIENDFTTDRYGGFVIGSRDDYYFPHIGKSDLSIKFNSVNLKNYLKEGNTVNNSQIGTYIINGLSHYYFQKNDDRSIHDIFTRLKDSVSSWKNEIFMTSCNIPVYFGEIYGDESHLEVYSSYNNSNNIPMEYFGRNEDGIYQYGTCIDDIRKYCRIELNTEYPYKIIETSNVKVYYNGKLINSEDGILLLPEGKLDVVRTNASYYSNKAREDGLIITNNNGKEITTDCYFITETSSGLKQKIIIGWTDTKDIPYPYIPEGYELTVGKNGKTFKNYPMSGFPVINDLSIKDNIYQVIAKEPSDTGVGGYNTSLMDIGFLLTITDDSYTSPNGGRGTQLRVHSNTDIYIRDRHGVTASSIETYVNSIDENGDDYSSVLNNDLLRGNFRLFRPDFADEIKSEDLDSKNPEKYYTGHYINLFGTKARKDNSVLRGVRKFPIPLSESVDYDYDLSYYTDQYYLSFCDDLYLDNIWCYGSVDGVNEPYFGYYCNGTYMYTYGTKFHTFYLPENSTIVKPGIYDKLGFISENDDIDVLICNNKDTIYDNYREFSKFFDSSGNYLDSGSDHLFIRSSYYISEDTIGTLAKTKTINKETGDVIESYNNYNIDGDVFRNEYGNFELYVGTSALFVSSKHRDRIHLKDEYIEECTSDGISSFDASDFFNFFKLRTDEFIKAGEDKKATLESLVSSKNLFILGSGDISNCNVVFAEQSLAGNRDVFDLNYEDTANSIVPPKTVNINMKYLLNHKQEYIKFGNDIVTLDGDSFKISPLVLKCSDPSITLGTFYYYKWFQSDIESISCGNKDSSFVSGGIKYCSFGFGTYTRDSKECLTDLYVTNLGNNDVFIEKIEQKNECPGGLLSGISRIPITLSLNNKYLHELSNSNYCKLFKDTDLNLLNDVKHFDYEFTINLVNNFQIHNETNEPFRYSQKVIIPWEGIDDTLAIFDNNINDSYIREIDSVVYGQNSEINIDLNEEKYNCSWESTSYELTVLPFKIDDLINYKNSNYQLTGNIDYYAFDDDDIQPVDQSCTVTQKNIVKTDSGSNLMLSDDHNIRLVFPQNDSSVTVYRKFKIKCRHSNTTVTINIAQRGLEDTAPIQLLNATETPLPNTESNILLHSSGTCLNYTNNLGVFKIKSKYDSIFDYTKNSIYLRYCYNNNDREVNMELVNQASIKKESDYYIITVRANFPPNFSGSLREGSLLIYSRNDENSARAKFNVYQGYLLPILSENLGKESETNYLLSEINGEYICNVGTLDNPITYYRSDNTINSRYFSIKFIQHELNCLATSNPLIPIEFGKFLSPGDGIIISSGYKINQTMESLESSDKKYCTIRYQSNPWEFLGNSKYIIDKDYNTDLIYKTDEDGEDDYPRLVHQFNISDMSNFKITEDDLIKITVRFSISDYKITENFLESTVNYKINSEVNTDYSPVKYVFYIKYN